MTLSVAAILEPRRPRILRGMLPYGVRTFLWPAKAARQRSSAIMINLSQLNTRETVDFADDTDQENSSRPLSRVFCFGGLVTAGLCLTITCSLVGASVQLLIRVIRVIRGL